MVRKLTLSAMIAALYAALTAALAPISYGPAQFRLSEILTLLPFFMPEAVPGLFIGCLAANVIGGFGPLDIAVGSSATLLAAWLTRRMPNLWLAALPPVIVNAAAVGAVIACAAKIPYLTAMLYIGASEAAVCLLLGVPLFKFIETKTDLLDKRQRK